MYGAPEPVEHEGHHYYVCCSFKSHLKQANAKETPPMSAR